MQELDHRSLVGPSGPKNDFQSGRVNEPSGFEPLKFYCISNELNLFYVYRSVTTLASFILHATQCHLHCFDKPQIMKFIP